MPLELVTPPAEEPLALAAAKRHLRVDESNTADDDVIASMIVAAREWAEHYMLRAIITQTLRLSLDAFPAGAIIVPRPPLQAVDHIEYVDPDGVTQILDPTYLVDAASEPARIFPPHGEAWPATRDTPNAVRVEYTAGYGDASAVPAAVVAAIRLRLGTLYEHRETVVVAGGVAELPRSQGAENLLYPIRVFHLA